MKRTWALGAAVLCGLLLSGCKKANPNQGSGVQKSEARSLPEFRKLKASGTANVEVTIGAPCPAEITTDDNLLGLIETTVKDGALVVRTGEKLRPKVPVRVRLCAATLNAIDADGASRVSVTQLAAADLTVRAAGAAQLHFAGSAATVRLELGTASHADLSELSNGTTTARIDQAASARLGHVEVLNVTISGPGSLRYRGEPSITQAVGKLGRLIQEQ